MDEPLTMHLLVGRACADCGGRFRTTSEDNLDIGICADCKAEWNFSEPEVANA